AYRHPLRPPLFPYTTLFRSCTAHGPPECASWRPVGQVSGPGRKDITGSERLSGAPVREARLPPTADRLPGRATRPISSRPRDRPDRKSTRLNSSHVKISYAV